MNLFLKGSKYFLGTLTAGCILSDTFARKVDRNLVSPIRNYKLTLENASYWRTSEDLVGFGKEMKEGIKRMVKNQ